MTRRDDWARIDVQMPADWFVAVQAAADAEAIPVSVWVRNAIRAALQAHKPESPPSREARRA